MSSLPLLLLATRNRHKVAEIRDILGHVARCRSLLDLDGAPDLVEDADSFAGNATRKAVQLFRWLSAQPSRRPEAGGGHLWVLADDSGLEVDALGGAPGVCSARFASAGARGSGNADDHANTRKLLGLLATVPVERRAARFRCVMALAGDGLGEDPGVCWEGDCPVILFSGTCEGSITLAPAGRGGFGYDPVFMPLGQQGTFAELGDEVKNRLSHRGKALTAFMDWLGRRSEPPLAEVAGAG